MGENEEKERKKENTSAIKIIHDMSIYLFFPAFFFVSFIFTFCDVDRYTYIPMKKNERIISSRCRSKLEWKNGDGRISLTHVLIYIYVYIYIYIIRSITKLLKRTC